MRFEIICWTSETAGCSRVFTPIGNYLHAGLSDYGQAINAMLIIAFVPKKTGKLTAAEKKSFGSLPKITFKRKQHRLEVRFLSRVAVAADEKSAIDLDLCNRAMPEVAEVLASLKAKISSTDDFDFPGFLADATALLEKPFPSSTRFVNPFRQHRQPVSSTGLQAISSDRGDCLSRMSALP